MIISIFGKDGAGKTTLVTHLAKHLADDNNFIGLVSLETRYGALQRVMGVEVEEKNSLLQAVLNPSSASSCFTKVTENMYILSMADITTIKDYDAMTALLGDKKTQNEEQLRRMQQFIDNIKDVFDILIIDCTDRITDVLTYAFLLKSDKIINVIQSNLDGIAYENAHAMLNELKLFEQKKINVLNKHNEKIINKSSVEHLLKQKIDVVIAYNESYVETSACGKVNKKAIAKLKEIEDVLFEKKEKKKFSFLRFKKKEGSS